MNYTNLTKEGELPYLEVSGTPYDIGFQHGSKLKEPIGEMLNKHTSLLCNDTGLSKEQLIQLVKKYIPFVENWDSDIFEEMRGIADGAEIVFNEKFLLEIPFAGANMLGRGIYGANSMPGCTDAAAAREATVDSKVFAGQTVDWYRGYMKYWIVQRTKPKTGPESIVASPVGQVHGRTGLNSDGISVSFNLLASPDWKLGVQVGLIGCRVLKQKKIGDAISSVVNTEPRASAYGWTIADQNGEIYYIESMPNDFEVIYAEDGLLVHTNNFLTQRFKSKDIIYPLHPESPIRVNRMRWLLKQKYGSITLNVLKEAWKDHLNHPQSICRHFDETLPEWKQIVTNVNVIVENKAKVVHILAGNPCKGKFSKYTFG